MKYNFPPKEHFMVVKNRRDNMRWRKAHTHPHTLREDLFIGKMHVSYFRRRSLKFPHKHVEVYPVVYQAYSALRMIILKENGMAFRDAIRKTNRLKIVPIFDRKSIDIFDILSRAVTDLKNRFYKKEASAHRIIKDFYRENRMSIVRSIVKEDFDLKAIQESGYAMLGGKYHLSEYFYEGVKFTIKVIFDISDFCDLEEINKYETEFSDDSSKNYDNYFKYFDRIDVLSPEENLNRLNPPPLNVQNRKIMIHWTILKENLQIPMLLLRRERLELIKMEIDAEREDGIITINRSNSYSWISFATHILNIPTNRTIKGINKEIITYEPNQQIFIDGVINIAHHISNALYTAQLLWKNKYAAKMAYWYIPRHMTEAGDGRTYDYFIETASEHSLLHERYRAVFEIEFDDLYKDYLKQLPEIRNKGKMNQSHLHKIVFLSIERGLVTKSQKKKLKIFYQKLYRDTPYPTTINELIDKLMYIWLWFQNADKNRDVMTCLTEYTKLFKIIDFYYESPVHIDQISDNEFDFEKIAIYDSISRDILKYLWFRKLRDPKLEKMAFVFVSNYRVFQKHVNRLRVNYKDPEEIEAIVWDP